MEPIFLSPIFKSTIWGGEKLKTRFGLDIPSENTGEAWMISSHKNGMSTITYPEKYSGMTLEQFYRDNPDFFGGEKKETFPLLVKIIDSKDKLSVQLHPDDVYAKNVGEKGKEECWYVIDCAENSEIVYGHKAKTKKEFTSHVLDGTLEEILIYKKVKKGDFFYVPAGTLHAIGEGIMILETQQNSDLTYRLYDYNRKDKDGKYRQLHLESGLNVLNIPHKEKPLNKKIEKIGKSTITEYVDGRYFKVMKWEVREKLEINIEEKYSLCTVIDGEGKMKIDNNTYDIKISDAFILPATVRDIHLSGNMSIIVSHSR